MWLSSVTHSHKRHFVFVIPRSSDKTMGVLLQTLFVSGKRCRSVCDMCVMTMFGLWTLGGAWFIVSSSSSPCCFSHALGSLRGRSTSRPPRSPRCSVLFSDCGDCVTLSAVGVGCLYKLSLCWCLGRWIREISFRRCPHKHPRWFEIPLFEFQE